MCRANLRTSLGGEIGIVQNADIHGNSLTNFAENVMGDFDSSRRIQQQHLNKLAKAFGVLKLITVPPTPWPS